MKVFLIVFALAVCGHAASLPRASFQDHFDDFMTLINEEVGEEMRSLVQAYAEDEDFIKSQEYLRSKDFANLAIEMEAIDEFNALIDYIEEDGITIHYFIALLHESLGIESRKASTLRLARSKTGTGFNGYLIDLLNLLPHEKLTALLEDKKATDEEFATTIDNLNNDTFKGLWDALFANELFQEEVRNLAEHEISVALFLDVVTAVFGASEPLGLADP